MIKHDQFTSDEAKTAFEFVMSVGGYLDACSLSRHLQEEGLEETELSGRIINAKALKDALELCEGCI